MRGGGGFRLKPRMEVSSVWMWPYRMLRAQAQSMYMTFGARAPSNQLAAWGAARHHRGAGHESPINPTNLRQVRCKRFALCFLCGLLVTCWAPFKGRRTTLSLRSLGRENCFAFARRCFLRTKSKKLFPSRPSFLRRRTSICFASWTFSRWQSENHEDSRLCRVRVFISAGTCEKACTMIYSDKDVTAKLTKTFLTVGGGGKAFYTNCPCASLIARQLQTCNMVCTGDGRETEDSKRRRLRCRGTKTGIRLLAVPKTVG